MSNLVLCTICARGGSKGVKNKNIREIHGKPLIAYSIEQARESGLFDHIVISTDSDEISRIGIEYGGEVFFRRDAAMASDSAGKLDVIKDAFIRSEEYYNKKYDYLVDLDATSPLRSVDDIINSFNQLVSNGNTNLITAMPARRSPYFNLIELTEQGQVVLSKPLPKAILCRQDSPKCYDMNASIYIWTRNAILNQPTIISSSTGLYVMPEERSIDIDSDLDLDFVTYMFSKGR